MNGLVINSAKGAKVLNISNVTHTSRATVACQLVCKDRKQWSKVEQSES